MKDSDRKLENLKQQAQSEITDRDTLCRLANNRDQEIRRYVAAHPNTPVEFLRMLGREFPQIVIQNPVFKKLLKEQPESEFVRISLARISTTPTEKLEQWSGLKNQAKSFYFALATNPNNSAKGLDLIVDNCPFSDVYKPILRDLKTRSSTLAKIVFKKNSLVNALSPQHPNITPKLRKILDFFAGDYYTDPSILFELIQRGVGSQKAFTHPNMSAKLLHQLSFVEDEMVKNQVATHPKTKEFTLDKILQEDPLIAGCHVAIRPDLSEEFALKLAQNQNQEILQALLLNPQISSQVLKTLLDRIYQLEPPAPNKEVYLCGNCSGITENIRIIDDGGMIPRSILYRNLLDDPIFLRDDITFTSAPTREKFVDHLQVTIEILERLSKDRYLSVRKRVAQSHKIDSQIIHYLAQDPSCLVRETIAKNTIIKSKAFARLYRDPCFNVRLAVVANLKTPLASIYKIVSDKKIYLDSQMRAKLLAELRVNEDRKMAIKGAEEPSTPIANLEKWLQHKSPLVRVAIAKRKDLSLKMMLVLAQDSSILVRSELARSPIISKKIAATLGQDSSLIVVRNLVDNSALSSRILTFLFEQICHEQVNPKIQEIEICNTCCPSKYYYDPNSPFPIYNPYDPRTYGLYDPLLHGEDPASSHKIERFAKHPKATVQILQQLKNNKYSAVREAVASSSKITEEIANELAQDLSCWVRVKIAKNKVTPQPFLDRLIYDRCFEVRLAVAKNSQTSLASLRDLMYDRDSDIAEAAMKNIDSPKT